MHAGFRGGAVVPNEYSQPASACQRLRLVVSRRHFTTMLSIPRIMSVFVPLLGGIRPPVTTNVIVSRPGTVVVGKTMISFNFWIGSAEVLLSDLVYKIAVPFDVNRICAVTAPPPAPTVPLSE